MKTLFLILRITTGLMATGALLILLAIVLLRSGAAFAKESAGAIGCVASLFTSGFTKGTAPKAADVSFLARQPAPAARSRVLIG